MQEVEQPPTARNVSKRDRLPNKRAFERDGSNYQMTVGFYLDGRAGEVFLNADRGDSLLDVMTSGAALDRITP